MKKITLLVCLCLISAMSFAGMNATTAISVKTFTPGSDASNVSVNTEVKVEFDQDIVLKDASVIQFVDTSNGSSVSFTTSVEGALLIFNYEGPLAYSTTYFVGITGAIEGLDAQTSWMFTTEVDSNPVTIVGNTPASDATGVSVNTPIKVQFNQDITLQSQANAQLTDMTNFGDTPAVSVSADGEYLVLTYAGTLEYETKYMVEVFNPVEGYGETIRWFFTTEEAAPEPIAIVSRTPDVDATNVSIDTEIKVEFNQNVTLNTGGFGFIINLSIPETGYEPAITPRIENNILYIDYEGSLEYGTTYYVELMNPVVGLSGYTGWIFTTEEAPEPIAMVSHTPDVNATNVSIDTEVKVEFNQDVTLNTGGGAYSITIFNIETEQMLTVTPWVENNILYIDYEGSLEYGTTYLVELVNPVVNYGGYTNWYFTTEEASEPIAIVSRTPDVDATNVPVNTEVKVEFNQDIVLKDASAIQFVDTSNGSPVSFTAGVEGAFLTLNYEGPLAYNATYFVGITGAIEGLDAQTSWMFTTEADPNPVTIIGYTPESDATNIPVNTLIKVQFDRDITLQSQVNAQLSNMTNFGDGPAVTVNADGEYLVLAYEGTLEHETKYMVEVFNPVEGYDQTIRWFFTTVKADAIDGIDAELLVYPNPASDFIYIKSSVDTLTKIYSLQGVKLIETTAKKIDLSGFNNGIYVVDVNGVKAKVVKK